MDSVSLFLADSSLDVRLLFGGTVFFDVVDCWLDVGAASLMAFLGEGFG